MSELDVSISEDSDNLNTQDESSIGSCRESEVMDLTDTKDKCVEGAQSLVVMKQTGSVCTELKEKNYDTEYPEEFGLKKPRISEDVMDEAEKIKRFEHCMKLLEQKKSVEKVLAGVVLIVKVLDLNELTSEQLSRLMKAVNLEKVHSLLTTPTPESLPQNCYRLPAINILMCYIPLCHGNPLLYKCLPTLSEIILSRHNNDSSLVNEAYACMALIATENTGRQALVDNESIGAIVNGIIEDSPHSEYGLVILRQCASDLGCATWEEEHASFDDLMSYLCKNFAQQQNEKSFDICDALRDILASTPEKILHSGAFKSHRWRKNLYIGLQNVMHSKLNADFRNRGLLLASATLEMFGIPAAIRDCQKGSELFMVIVSMACVEVRLTLEDTTMDQILAASVSATACYIIIEESIKFLVNGAEGLSDEHKQLLYKLLKETFDAVLQFLGDVAQDPTNENPKAQMFVMASVRVLCAWLAEETIANRAETFKLLPYIMNLAEQNLREKKVVKKAKKLDPSKTKPVPDLLRFMLPGLCNLTAEDFPRGVLLDLNLETILFDYLVAQWNLACRTGGTIKKEKLEKNTDCIITICNIFLNIVVQEPARIKTEPIYYQLVRFLISKLVEIPNENSYLHLTGCFCTLGLLVLRHQHTNIPRNETGIFKFIQSSVRFLWDAYNVEESLDYSTLVVASAYEPVWSDLIDFWFIGIHALTSLLTSMPWLTEFLVESEWPQSLLATLLLVKNGSLEQSLKYTYEEFLCALVKSGDNLRKLFLLKEAEEVCQNHDMQNLAAALKG